MKDKQIIIRPILTEKARELSEKGEYVFEVAKTSNKNEIKKTIEELFNVKVEKVRVVNLPQKIKRLGRVFGKKSGIKKAIVKLKEGQKIDIISP
jgi:large subunit ribosomal protein L23